MTGIIATGAIAMTGTTMISGAAAGPIGVSWLHSRPCLAPGISPMRPRVTLAFSLFAKFAGLLMRAGAVGAAIAASASGMRPAEE
jgi:hypothetical protein